MIIYINGRGMNAPELKAYISELEAENAELRAKVESANRQIAEYDDELRKSKELLRVAVEDIRHCMHYYDPCEVCSLLGEDGECPATDDDDCKEKYKWCYEEEALALIGEKGDTE